MDTDRWLGRNLCVFLEFDYVLAFVQRDLSRRMFVPLTLVIRF